MPNWIEGVLKVRGTKENITNFIKNGIDYNDYKHEILRDEKGNFSGVKDISVPRNCEKTINDDEIFIKNTMDLYINHTHRMFVNSKNIEHWWISNEGEKEVMCIDIRQAWGFDAENFKKISETFNVDLRVFGTEQGMEFCQLVEVQNGNIIKNQEISFDDFRWECPDPRLGG